MIGRYTDLAKRIVRRQPGIGGVRVVAVDGPTGAGKTTFAARLTRAVESVGATTAQVHIDDLLDGWDDMVTFWPRLEDCVLAPLGRGEAGAYQPYDWVAGHFTTRLVTVPVRQVLVLDGVTSGRAVIRDRLALSVFVTAPAPLRLRRVLDRDGDGVEPLLRTWMTAEAAHFAADATEAHADLVVMGAPTAEHDPRAEYVQIGGLWR